MKRYFLLVLLALSFDLPASADLKVAVVDTAQVFDAFYKTKDVATRIAAQKTRFEKEIRDIQQESAAAQQEAQNLNKGVHDTSSPLEVRKSKDAALAQKMQGIQSMDRELDEMRRSRSQEIQAELLDGHREISDEMIKAIHTYATAKGYDLILDKSASFLPFIPYRSWKVVDLTSDIIARLNASAPSH